MKFQYINLVRPWRSHFSGSCQKVNFCVNFLPGNKNFVIIVKPDQAGVAEGKSGTDHGCFVAGGRRGYVEGQLSKRTGGKVPTKG
jgi:hypothetical protein